MTTWVDLEDIMLGEKVRQRKIPYDLSYMQNLKKNLKNKTKKQAHRYREQIDGCKR